jgi:hypothetical protein
MKKLITPNPYKIGDCYICKETEKLVRIFDVVVDLNRNKAMDKIHFSYYENGKKIEQMHLATWFGQKFKKAKFKA